MTVGIACLCSETKTDGTSHPGLLIATDTQLTGDVSTTSLARKWDAVGAKWLSLLSANDLGHAETLIAELRKQPLSAQGNDIDAVVELLAGAKARVRERLAAAALLPPGLSLEQFYAKGRGQLGLSGFQRLFDKLTAYELECTLLVAGFDEVEHRPHIVSLGDGRPVLMDRGTFCCIGSGEWIATGILSAYDPVLVGDWRETAYRMYAAKKASEKAEGVDEWTFMALLTGNGVHYLAPEVFKGFYDAYGALPPEAAWIGLANQLRNLDPTQRPDGTAHFYPWAELE